MFCLDILTKNLLHLDTCTGILFQLLGLDGGQVLRTGRKSKLEKRTLETMPMARDRTWTSQMRKTSEVLRTRTGENVPGAPVAILLLLQGRPSKICQR